MSAEESITGLELVAIEMMEALEEMSSAERVECIERAILSLVAAVKAAGDRPQLDITSVVNAIRDGKPVVTVNVPAPVVHFNVPEQIGAKWKVVYPTIHGTQTMTVERIG